jgi:hypothetical protein
MKGLLLLGLLAFGRVDAAEDFAVYPTERARLPLFRVSQQEFAGAGAATDLSIPLPQAIAFQSGSELHLTLNPSSVPLVQPAAIAVALNGRVLIITNFVDGHEAPIALRVPVPESTLAKGMNVLSLRLVRLGTTNAPLPNAGNVRWVLRRPECFLDLSFARVPLFEELPRFPHSLAEEKLLRADSRSPTQPAPAAPVLAVLLPGVCGEAQLRVAAIAAARLGQLDYLEDRDVRLAALESWKSETSQRNGLLIARRDQLGGVEIPSPVSSVLAALLPGQGLLAEFFQGKEPRQRRVVLVTGVDDAGLEKAGLTLGSGPALRMLVRSPAVLDRAPLLSAPPAPAHAPPRIDGLYQIQQFLLTDPFARQAMFAVPAGPSVEQVRTLFALWMHLGRSLPAAPVLWPAVATYQPGQATEPGRWSGRNILALGALAQWPGFLPKAARPPALFLSAPDAPHVLFQGRNLPRAGLEPTLAFAEMFPSPWSASNTLVLVGGWQDYAIPATRRMLTDPASPAALVGNLAAMDELGRAASYDLRRVGNESFAAQLRRMIPPGVGTAETAQRLAARQRALVETRLWSARLSAVCAACCLLLVAARLVLTWQQTRLRNAALAAERAAEETV